LKVPTGRISLNSPQKSISKREVIVEK